MAWPSRGSSARLTQHPRPDLIDEAQLFGNGDEGQRWYERAISLGEAYQRLEPNEAPIRHFKQRLIVQLEPIVDDGVPDRFFKLDPRLQLGIHLGQEQPDTIPTIGFASIKSKIRALQQPLR